MVGGLKSSHPLISRIKAYVTKADRDLDIVIVTESICWRLLLKIISYYLE